MPFPLHFLTIGHFDMVNSALFRLFKSFPERFFHNAVKTSSNVFLSVCQGTKCFPLRFVYEFWEEKEIIMSQVSTVHLLGSTALVCLSEILKRDLPQQNIVCPCAITVDTTVSVFLQQNSKDLQNPFTLPFVCDAGGQPANTSRRRPCGYL